VQLQPALLGAPWPATCRGGGRLNANPVVRAVPVQQPINRPNWVDALEASLLLAIGLFSLITWIVTIGLLGH
jgi:hypothetical protein